MTPLQMDLNTGLALSSPPGQSARGGAIILRPRATYRGVLPTIRRRTDSGSFDEVTDVQGMTAFSPLETAPAGNGRGLFGGRL